MNVKYIEHAGQFKIEQVCKKGSCNSEEIGGGGPNQHSYLMESISLKNAGFSK